tara:strand:+ start:644 stop:1021 length:378 start_codon:yes stop_codon:yes gene_type:complete
MGYAIEMTQIATNTDVMRNQASSFTCETQYIMNDDPNKNKINCVHVVIFSDDNFHNLLSYIKKIKRERVAHIECIYHDDISCDLLYASSRYLKKTTREFEKDYKKNNIIENYTDTKLRIHQAMQV